MSAAARTAERLSSLQRVTPKLQQVRDILACPDWKCNDDDSSTTAATIESMLKTASSVVVQGQSQFAELESELHEGVTWHAELAKDLTTDVDNATVRHTQRQRDLYHESHGVFVRLRKTQNNVLQLTLEERKNEQLLTLVQTVRSFLEVTNESQEDQTSIDQHAHVIDNVIKLRQIVDSLTVSHNQESFPADFKQFLDTRLATYKQAAENRWRAELMAHAHKLLSSSSSSSSLSASATVMALVQLNAAELEICLYDVVDAMLTSMKETLSSSSSSSSEIANDDGDVVEVDVDSLLDRVTCWVRDMTALLFGHVDESKSAVDASTDQLQVQWKQRFGQMLLPRVFRWLQMALEQELMPKRAVLLSSFVANRTPRYVAFLDAIGELFPMCKTHEGCTRAREAVMEQVANIHAGFARVRKRTLLQDTQARIVNNDFEFATSFQRHKLSLAGPSGFSASADAECEEVVTAFLQHEKLGEWAVTLNCLELVRQCFCLFEEALACLGSTQRAEQDVAVELFAVLRDCAQLWLVSLPVCWRNDLLQIPQLSFLFHNDCLLMAHVFAHFNARLQLAVRHTTEQEKHRQVCVLDVALSLLRAGKECLVRQRSVQRDTVASGVEAGLYKATKQHTLDRWLPGGLTKRLRGLALDDSKHDSDWISMDVNSPDDVAHLKACLKGVVADLRRMKTGLLKVTDERTASAFVGCLLHEATSMLADFVVHDVADISMNVATELGACFDFLLYQVDQGKSTTSATSGKEEERNFLTTPDEIASFMKIKTLGELLDPETRLIEIGDKLPLFLYSMSKQELIQMLKKLYMDSDKRTALIEQISATNNEL